MGLLLKEIEILMEHNQNLMKIVEDLSCLADKLIKQNIQDRLQNK